MLDILQVLKSIYLGPSTVLSRDLGDKKNWSECEFHADPVMSNTVLFLWPRISPVFFQYPENCGKLIYWLGSRVKSKALQLLTAALDFTKEKNFHEEE